MKNIPRHILIPLALLIYLAIMSIWAYPDFTAGRFSPLYYFGVIGGTFVVIVILYFVLRKKDRLRKKNKAVDNF